MSKAVLMGRSRYKIFEDRQPYFLTCSVVHWLPLLAEPRVAILVLESLRFLQDEKRLELYAYVIMDNHLHIIASANDLQKEIANFKSFTARSIIEALKAMTKTDWLDELRHFKAKHKKDREYQFWQEGAHPEQIRGLEMMKQKVEYIHLNPVRRGLVQNPEDWIYSSAGNYLGKSGLLAVKTDW